MVSTRAPQAVAGGAVYVSGEIPRVTAYEEGLPGHVLIETAEFEDLGDRTKVTTTSLFHTTEERDGMLEAGMEGGLNESYARLDELLARL